jgi:two-component sensor histidine kinase
MAGFMKKAYFIFIFSVFLGLSPSAAGQEYGSPGQTALDTYVSQATPEAKLQFFFETPSRYRDHSIYQWMDRVNADLENAATNRDSAAVQVYSMIRAHLYYDLGEYRKSASQAQELYLDLDRSDPQYPKLLLELIDKSYGQMRQYEKQIEIRKRKRELGFSENITFYDIYANLGLHRKAMETYILEVKKTLDPSDFYQLADYNNHIGHFLLMDRSGATAMSYFKKAQGYIVVYLNDINLVKTEREIHRANILKGAIEGNIGKAHMLSAQYREALPYLESSLGLLQLPGTDMHREEIAENNLALAESYMELGNLRKAYEYLDKDLETDRPDLVSKQLRLMAAYFGARKDFGNETFFLRQFLRFQDSMGKLEQDNEKERLASIVSNEELESMKLKSNQQELELERGRAEMEAQDMRINLVFISLVFTLLGFAGLVYAYLKSIKNQRLIAEQKRIIENSLVEKDSLLKEIHHRVKNNLQMVSSLLSLQTKNTRSKAAIEALEEGKTRVKAMALIHQKLYQNDDLSVIEMQGYIESLINSIQSVFRKGGHQINISIEAEGVELDIDRAIPIGLILNELVSNSFKYAFPEEGVGGNIYIHIRKNGEGGFFEYSDNGVGLPPDSDEREKGSMGIRLIKRLVNQLQSNLNVDKTEEGVRFWFHFK